MPEQTYFSPADVEMFKNFSLPIAKDKCGRTINLWGTKKISKATKREIERAEREQRIKELEAHYNNPENEGRTFFPDTLFEQVEENREIHLNKKMISALSQINDE